MLTTMSSSCPPSSRACFASATLTAVVCPPCGKPIVVLACTVLPLRISAHRLR